MTALFFIGALLILIAVVGALHDSPWDHHDCDHLGDAERYRKYTNP